MKKKKIGLTLLLGVAFIVDATYTLRTAYRIGVAEEKIDEMQKTVEEMKQRTAKVQNPGLMRAVIQPTPREAPPVITKAQATLSSTTESTVNRYFSALQKHLTAFETKMTTGLQQLNEKIANMDINMADLKKSAEDKPI